MSEPEEPASWSQFAATVDDPQFAVGGVVRGPGQWVSPGDLDGCVIPPRTADRRRRLAVLAASLPEAYIPLSRRTTDEEGPRGLV